MLKHSSSRFRFTGLVLASLLLTLTACPGSEDPDEDGGTPVTDAGPDGGPVEGPAVCADGKKHSTEACDDGNTISGDGCKSDCTQVEDGFECPTPGNKCVVATACGNGLVEPGEVTDAGVTGEVCDDRNKADGDGCSANCKVVEQGWSCPFQGQRCRAAQCGDSIIAGEEECEDGNAAKGDGCSDICRLEPGYKCEPGKPCVRTTCGDNKKEGTEQCDDGNNDMGDGCSPLCVLEPKCVNGACQAICGDGVILPGDTTEQCDDGNVRANDGCSSTCKLEEGFACTRITESPPASVEVPVVYRDFRGKNQPVGGAYPATTHPDFDDANGGETGIVGPLYTSTLTNLKPTYAKAGVASNTTHGKTAFDQWYRDVPGVNKTVVSTLKLNKQGTGSYVFDNQSFFPLDALGWVASMQENKQNDGNGIARNFSFTSEARYWFEFKGTEVLSFRGDDDVFVYINGKLALDLGGVHGPLDGQVSLANATTVSDLGLVKGKIYEVVVFQAERHITGSSYKLTLNNFETQRTECKSTCGNGAVDVGEQCDKGNLNGPGYNKCSLTCIWNARCGDGVTQFDFGETCDDANTNDRDGCRNTCQVDVG
ncbi:DUF4215 domain-containing protein [Corallococcus sicarius]|uniref:DUF4215 domain-containing protein n=1 Tax=Corallococcus sicarius TaxID=2316726 RepID=A0A3A8MXU8_9BACT|nr:DUF4215 domain-containing protein [Corallococcus sicarius]RKH37097.1 DUF4215 domain-containing protein [Corallococcus sicarius]